MKASDIIVIIITFTICVFLLAILADVIINDTNISESSADRIDHMITGLIAIISLYIGSKVK